MSRNGQSNCASWPSSARRDFMATATVFKRQFPTNTNGRPLLPRFRRALSSTVGSKFIVALTGLALTGFVIAHMAGNLQLFKSREALNGYAEFLKGQGALLWAARLGLLVVFV